LIVVSESDLVMAEPGLELRRDFVCRSVDYGHAARGVAIVAGPEVSLVVL